MSKLPKKNKQWAQDAMGAFDEAVALLSAEELQALTPEEKAAEFLRFALPLAAIHRGITHKQQTQKAWDFMLPRVQDDLDAEGESSLPMLFLLSYLDAHIAWGYISEAKHHSIMDDIMSFYDVPDAIPAPME